MTNSRFEVITGIENEMEMEWEADEEDISILHQLNGTKKIERNSKAAELDVTTGEITEVGAEVETKPEVEVKTELAAEPICEEQDEAKLEEKEEKREWTIKELLMI